MKPANVKILLAYQDKLFCARAQTVIPVHKSVTLSATLGLLVIAQKLILFATWEQHNNVFVQTV